MPENDAERAFRRQNQRLTIKISDSLIDPLIGARDRHRQPFRGRGRTIRQMRSPLSLFRLRHWPRRLAALLMLVVQSGVALAPVLDHDGRIAGPHAEQRGNRHPRQHNERTCVVCAVRALQAPVVRDDPAPLPLESRTPVEFADREESASRDPPPSNASRAPPLLS